MDVIRECAEAWERLAVGKTQPGDISLLVFNQAIMYPSNRICRTNLTVKQSPNRVTPDQLPHIPSHENLYPAPIDPSIDKWFFISGAAN